MTASEQLALMDTKAKLSTLWLFVLLNMIFRDIHELFRTGALEEIMAMTMSETSLLVFGIVLELIIVMVVLARLLPYRANRWTNIVVGGIAIPLTLAAGLNDLDDMFFAGVEIAALAFIVWLAWNWRPAPSSAVQAT